MNIWETHDIKSNLRKVPLPNGDFYYVMDEFYKYPDLVVKEIKKITPVTFKINNINDGEVSYNDKYFRDHRTDVWVRGLYQLNIDLGKLVKQDPANLNEMEKYKMGVMCINHATIYRHPFNNLKNDYWYPHVDSGWNGLVYLNKNDSGKNGTNIYSIRKNRNRIIQRIMNTHEHSSPWISKDQLDLLDTTESKYNSFAFYNGVKYFHGMNIGDDQYVCNMGEELEEERMNQVFFFNNNFAMNRNNAAMDINFVCNNMLYGHSGPVGKLASIVRKILKRVATMLHSGV